MVAEEMINIIDGFLLELGTSGLVDARKARDQLMDLRLMLMNEIPTDELVPDTIEGIEEIENGRTDSN